MEQINDIVLDMVVLMFGVASLVEALAVIVFVYIFPTDWEHHT